MIAANVKLTLFAPLYISVKVKQQGHTILLSKALQHLLPGDFNTHHSKASYSNAMQE